MDLFNTAFFKKNRQKLRKLLPQNTAALIAANTEIEREKDVPFPFRQDSDFWYLTGVEEPDCWLLISPNLSGNEGEILVVPDKNEHKTQWEGSEGDTQQFVKQSGIKTVLHYSDALGILRRVINIADAVYIPTYHKPALFMPAQNPSKYLLHKFILENNPVANIRDVSKFVKDLRTIKSAAEIKAIKEAIAITGQGLDAARQVLQPGSFENQIEAEITKVFGTQNAKHAYLPIVAGGHRSCTIHYVKNNQRLNKGELLLIDTGAEVSNYAADITRVYGVDGKLTKRQQEVYEAVKITRTDAIDSLHIGISYRDWIIEWDENINQRVNKLLGKKLQKEQLRIYNPHNISHFLGLGVHDVGDYNQELKSGMVITVEPGIYIPEEGIGIRLEDDVLITDDGCENLSKGIPL